MDLCRIVPVLQAAREDAPAGAPVPQQLGGDEMLLAIVHPKVCCTCRGAVPGSYCMLLCPMLPVIGEPLPQCVLGLARDGDSHPNRMWS